MKNRFLLFAAALLLAACGGSSTIGWQTDELRYIPFQDENGPWCYVDLSDKGKPWVTGLDMTLFYDGFAIVIPIEEDDQVDENSEDGYCFLSAKGAWLNGMARYRDLTIFHDGIAWVARKGAPLAAIDRKGNLLFELKQAETVYAFHDGLAVFSDAEERWGLVDRKGNVVVEPRWSNCAAMVVNGLIAVQNPDTGWGLASASGEMIVSGFSQVGTTDVDSKFRWNYLQALAEGRIPVRNKSGQWGVVNRKGDYLINPQFDELILDGKNYLFRKGRQWGWCDAEGRYLINPQFRDASPFAGAGLAAVQDKDRSWGYIDAKGDWVIAAQFREAGPFLPCGIAPVCDDGSDDWGAVDKKGRWVINPQFRTLYDFGADDKLLAYDRSGSLGIVNASGKYLTQTYSDSKVELVQNRTGIGAKFMAQSDYVDVEHYAELIDAEIRLLRRMTAGELKQTYGLTDAKFPKSGGAVTLYNRKRATKEMTFKCSVTSIQPWTKASDGWFGYTYTFRPETTADSYTFVAEFSAKGRVRRFANEILEALKRRYPSGEKEGTIAIPGYSFVLGCALSNGGILFQIKPE